MNNTVENIRKFFLHLPKLFNFTKWLLRHFELYITHAEETFYLQIYTALTLPTCIFVHLHNCRTMACVGGRGLSTSFFIKP